MMRDMLEARLDRSILESAGRTAELVQFELPV